VFSADHTANGVALASSSSTGLPIACDWPYLSYVDGSRFWFCRIQATSQRFDCTQVDTEALRAMRRENPSFRMT
jgi:hypothetical protein